jgi:hypothetical protein
MRKLIWPSAVVSLFVIAGIVYAPASPPPPNQVTSVFGRTGAVVAQSGDYSVSQVTGAAPTASPSFTGTPSAPTPTVGDNSTSIATTAFVHASLPTAPIRVTNLSFLSQTAALPTTTLYTPQADGNYRVSIYAVSLNGFASNFSLYFQMNWTDDFGSAGICSGSGGGESNGGTINDTCNIFPTFATAGYRDVTLHAKANTPITLGTQFGSAAYTYNLYIVVEQL